MLGVTVFLLTVGALAAGWAYFEWMAPEVAGKVVDKQQRIIGARHAAPGRYLSTSFTLVNQTEEDRYLYGSPLTTDIHVDQQTYDANDVGASVRVKYLPINPRTVRLVNQPLVPRSILMLVGAGILAALLLLFTRTRPIATIAMLMTAAVLYVTPGPPSGRVAVTAAAALAAVAAAAAVTRKGSARVWLLAWAVVSTAAIIWPAVGGTADVGSATADVRDVTEFRAPTSTRARTRLITLQEFDRVHAAFVPEGATQPVFMLDFIDHGSVPSLTEGGKIAVQYRRDMPESARLVAGERTHYWKNAVIPVGAVVGFAWLTTRKRKAGKKPTRKAQAV